MTTFTDQTIRTLSAIIVAAILLIAAASTASAHQLGNHPQKDATLTILSSEALRFANECTEATTLLEAESDAITYIFFSKMANERMEELSEGQIDHALRKIVLRAGAKCHANLTKLINE